MTDDNDTDEMDSTRRGLLVGVAGLGAAGIFGAGRVTAQTEPDGEIGFENPYLRAYVDRQVFVGRTSDPDDPENGTMWFREDL